MEDEQWRPSKEQVEQEIQSIDRGDYRMDNDLPIYDAATILSAEVVACHRIIASVRALLNPIPANREDWRDGSMPSWSATADDQWRAAIRKALGDE
jgi:hypothetical protein